MYNRLKGILTVGKSSNQPFQNNNSNIKRGAGPTSLNFVYRKNMINKINEENNAFLSKLQQIKSMVPDTKSLVRVHDNVGYQTNE